MLIHLGAGVYKNENENYFVVTSDGEFKLFGKKCEECVKNWADLPSPICPGCEAYKSHQQ